MDAKKLGVCAGFLFLIILVLGIISAAYAQPCRVTERASCSEKELILMGLSSETNAHGELVDQGNYNYVLCCDFSEENVCSGTNKILGLSSETNAHAEIPEKDNYGYDICYGNLKCKSFDDACSEDYITEMISLSDETNAHLGEFGSYSEKICCYQDLSTLLYWADADENIISEVNVIAGQTEVSMILSNSGLPEGAINFEIYEDDLLLDDFIRTISGLVDSEGNAKASWTINQEDLENGRLNGLTVESSNNMVFYFKVNEKESNSLDINIAEIPNCGTIDFCMNYGTESECENDFCEVAINSVETNNPDVTCGAVSYNPITTCYKNTTCTCMWDDVNEICGPNYEDVITKCDEGGPETPFNIGKCSYEENTTDDDCDNGFLTYSWKGNWIWDEDNSFIFNPDEGDYREDPIGAWRYDPKDESGLRMSEKCVDGSNSISCPAQIQLPFFGVYEAIGAVLLILLIYILLVLKKKKSSRKKHK